jgi:hypothetical protein
VRSSGGVTALARTFSSGGDEPLRGLRAAQYVRMSTYQQKYSIENRAAAIAAYASERKIEIVKTYVSKGRSGLRINSRKDLQKLIADVQERKADFDVILVYDVSRWAASSPTTNSSHSSKGSDDAEPPHGQSSATAPAEAMRHNPGYGIMTELMESGPVPIDWSEIGRRRWDLHKIAGRVVVQKACCRSSSPQIVARAPNCLTCASSIWTKIGSPRRATP